MDDHPLQQHFACSSTNLDEWLYFRQLVIVMLLEWHICLVTAFTVAAGCCPQWKATANTFLPNLHMCQVAVK